MSSDTVGMPDHEQELINAIEKYLDEDEEGLPRKTVVRSVMITEVFVEGKTERSLDVRQIGRQLVTPWDMLGFANAAAIRAQAELNAHALQTIIDHLRAEDDDHE